MEVLSVHVPVSMFIFKDNARILSCSNIGSALEVVERIQMNFLRAKQKPLHSDRTKPKIFSHKLHKQLRFNF
jgi:hypothetical protein